MFRPLTIAILAACLGAAPCLAQGGYEFEVYSTDIAPRGEVELETHLNFVASGSKLVDDEEGRVTHRAFRTSVELGTGLTRWLEGSIYAVGYARNGAGVQYVGNRGRLTAVIPDSRLPFRIGISQELGYARFGFAENRWAYEVTPILEQRIGQSSFVLNPAFERGLGSGKHEWEFEPRAALTHSFGDDESVGVEYYSVLGPVSSFDEKGHQIHQIFATASRKLRDLMSSGFGIGRGLTRNSDRWVIISRFEIEL